MPSLIKKRSHTNMSEAGKAIPDSSTTVVGDHDQFASQARFLQSHINPTPTMQPSTPGDSMGPPAPPSSFPLSQKPPRSAQGPQITQGTEARSVSPEKASITTGAKPDVEGQNFGLGSQNDADLAESSAVDGPQDRIGDFDWEDLHQRYHDQRKEFRTNEQAIFTEFRLLCNVSQRVLLL